NNFRRAQAFQFSGQSGFAFDLGGFEITRRQIHEREAELFVRGENGLRLGPEREPSRLAAGRRRIERRKVQGSFDMREALRTGTVRAPSTIDRHFQSHPLPPGALTHAPRFGELHTHEFLPSFFSIFFFQLMSLVYHRLGSNGTPGGRVRRHT
ncbi:MAG TPA: hypothetical protein VF492_13135, partial [Verrucomicrobiae bacterium]